MKTATDLTGQRFGKLTVLERMPNVGKNVMWRCRCDCGKHSTTRGDSLRKGVTKSCGCIRVAVGITRMHRWRAALASKRANARKAAENGPADRDAPHKKQWGGVADQPAPEWKNAEEAAQLLARLW